MNQIDLTIANPKILHFLDGRSFSVPTKEFTYLFEHQDHKPCFLEDLQSRLVSIANFSKTHDTNFNPEGIAQASVVIAHTSLVFLDHTSSDEEKAEAISNVAAAFKYMWIVATSSQADDRSR